MASKRTFRGDRLWQSQQAICGEMVGQFRRFFDGCATHEDILVWRQKYIFDIERWQRLTLVYKAKVEQCFYEHIEALQRRLFWTMWMPGYSRWLCADCDKKKWDENVRSLAEGSGAHCYVVRICQGTKIVHPRVVIPWTRKERDEDLAAGRLLQSQLDIIREQHLAGADYMVRHYWPQSSFNGVTRVAYEAVERL